MYNFQMQIRYEWVTFQMGHMCIFEWAFLLKMTKMFCLLVTQQQTLM